MDVDAKSESESEDEVRAVAHRDLHDFVVVT